MRDRPSRINKYRLNKFQLNKFNFSNPLFNKF